MSLDGVSFAQHTDRSYGSTGTSLGSITKARAEGGPLHLGVLQATDRSHQQDVTSLGVRPVDAMARSGLAWPLQTHVFDRIDKQEVCMREIDEIDKASQKDAVS